MRAFPIVLIVWPVLCAPAVAQSAMTPMPSLPTTSPLGMAPNPPIGGTGLPFGATEVASSGVSPLPSSASGSGGCTTLGAAASAYGSTAAYDGGGVALGAAAPASMAPAQPTSSAMVDTSGLSGMCGSGAGGFAASSRPTVAALGGPSRTGIALGSTEIGNLGVSTAVPVLPVSVTPVTSPAAAAAPAPPTVSSGVPLVTIAGISSVAAPPVPGLMPGIASKLHR